MIEEVTALPDPIEYWDGAEITLVSFTGRVIGRFILRVEPTGKRYWERL